MEQDFSVYPNPTNSNVFVTAANDFEEIAEIKVYDSKGALQLIQKVTDPTVSEIEIGLGELPQGVYYIQIIGSNTNSNLKVMKTN
jgi:hypothetical protein